MWTFKLILAVIVSWGSGVKFMSIVEEKDNLIMDPLLGTMLGTCPSWLSSVCGWLFHFLMHFLYNCQLIEEMHMLASLHININKARHEAYKYSIRKQRLSTSHSVVMSDMSNLHHNCNIWITPYIDKELLMALWPSMNTCREGSPLSLEFKMIEY